MMKTLLSIKHAMACLATICVATGAYAQFTPGNVVVLQAGDGSSTLANTGNAIVLREFTPTGTSSYSMAIPTASTSGMAINGTATLDGFMTLSSNGQALIIPGYAGIYTSNVSGTTGSVLPRIIGSVNAAGTFTRVATSTTFHSGGNMRGAASDGNGNYWSTGNSQGVNYFGTASAPSNIQSTIGNLRSISIQAGDLAFSTGSGVPGIYVVNTIGSGTTSVPASTVSLVVPTGTGASPCQFAIAPTLTYGYVADDRAASAGGGIQKWVFTGTAWNLAYTFTASTQGARGLAVNFSGSNPVLYATTSDASGNQLVSIVDGGSLATSTITTLATAGSNTIFRGVAFSPTAASSCTAPVIASVTGNSPICSNQPLQLNSTVTGSGPITYAWAGSGSFSSTSVANPTVTGASAGGYTLTASNTCGTVSAVYNATVTPTPTVSANAASICSGGSATLTASGASTYSWSTGATTSTIAVNPTSTTVYTVTGTNGGSCSSAITTTVTVIASPTVSVNSTSICAGGTATLTASGASTYTWTTPASNNASISVSPSATTVYTVSANAAGCVGTFSATGTVSVTALPNLTVTPSSPTICAGQASTLTVTGATSQTWTPGAQTTASVSVTPTTTTTYTVTGTNGTCANTKTVTVTVNPSPTVTASSATICAGKTATLTATGNAATYTWTPGGATGTTFTVSPAVGLNNYTVTGTSAQGCNKTTTTSVIVAPNPTVTASASSSVVCSGSTVTLTGGGASTYVWSNGVANGTAFTPTSTASYTVTGTSALSGCTATAVTSVTVNTCTGIHEVTGNVVFNVYPNPNKGQFTLQSSVFPATLIVVDITGKQVIRREITEMETSLNAADLTNGIYYVSLITETGTANAKMVISK